MTGKRLFDIYISNYSGTINPITGKRPNTKIKGLRITAINPMTGKRQVSNAISQTGIAINPMTGKRHSKPIK